MTQIEKIRSRTKLTFHVFVCILCIGGFGKNAYAQPWTQLGQDIVGEAITDWSGGAVAMNSDGNIIAVGAQSNDGNGVNAGHVVAYSWNGFFWAQRGNEINGPSPFEQSGYAVSLDSVGNTLAITAPGNGVPGSDIGHTWIYGWNGSDWTLKGNVIDGELINDRSGESVSLSSDGNTVAIGAEQNGGAGHVRVYEWDGTAWVQKGIDIDGESVGDRSGASVSLSSDGNTVAIGADGADGIGVTSVGHARVYLWNGTAWVQKGNDIDGESFGDRSGISISIDAAGNTLAVGAYQNDGIGTRGGHVRIYTWNGSAWIQKGIDLNGLNDDQLGWAVSISADGNVVACGAWSNGQNSGMYSGYVRVFTWNGSAWVQTGIDIGQNTYSVQSVSLSDNGNTLVLGIPRTNGNGNGFPSSNYAGMARAYQFDTQLGIDDDNVDNAMFVYPNPTSGKFKVTGITGRIEIFNPVGQLIYSRVVLRTEATIDLSDQANGSYILKVIDEKHSFSEMFFIQK